MGNFSSKLAFRATGLKVAGGYPPSFIYISPFFLENHLAVYLHFFTKNIQYHSIANNPSSAYDQAISEYGLLGICALIFFYFYFFVKHIKRLTYGLPLIILVLQCLLMDYWFEQLSVVVFFEYMLFMDIKENKKTTT